MRRRIDAGFACSHGAVCGQFPAEIRTRRSEPRRCEKSNLARRTAARLLASDDSIINRFGPPCRRVAGRLVVRRN